MNMMMELFFIRLDKLLCLSLLILKLVESVFLVS